MKQNGFTLIEVLVAIVILAVGLVGIAGLQAQSLRNSQDSLFRTQANAFANDLADRMRANARGALSNALPYQAENIDAISDQFSNCTTCTGAELAGNDLAALKQNITQSNLPSGDVRISGQSINADEVIYTISIQWDSRRDGNPGETCGSDGLLCYSTTVRINSEG